MPIEPAGIVCAHCNEEMAQIALLDRDQSLPTIGIGWTLLPIEKSFWSGIKPSGRLTAWRCPRCFEVRVFALTDAQLKAQEERLEGRLELTEAGAEGAMSLEGDPSDE